MDRTIFLILTLSLLLSSAGHCFGQATVSASTTQEQALPKTWVDAKTGHRVTRISDVPGSKALYFNVNAFTPDGNNMIYMSPSGIHVLDMATLTSNLVVSGSVHHIVVGTRTRRVFFMKKDDQHVYVVSLDSGQVVQLAAVPAHGVISSVNADETLLAGTYLEGGAANFKEWKYEAEAQPSQPSPMAVRLAANVPEDMFTMNVSSGEIRVILHGTDWLNHVMFSPTDPTLIMYSHEGPSLAVDRIWTIRSDGSQNASIHRRTSQTESIVHEFWSKDGQTIWYDLQEAKGTTFALGSYEIATGKSMAYHLDKADASIHYNAASDNSFFCADGNIPAHAEVAGPHGHSLVNRQWIEALYPVAGNLSSSLGSTTVGVLKSVRLADMTNNNYHTLEPNVRFSPNNRLVFFNSNMFGSSYVFAVEMGRQ
jgi:oligogalacturonide lyase